MLASLNIRRWQAALTDKKITAEVATNHAVNAKTRGQVSQECHRYQGTELRGRREHGIGAAQQALLLYASLESRRCAHPAGIDL